jgi:hypothetical protein
MFGVRKQIPLGGQGSFHRRHGRAHGLGSFGGGDFTVKSLLPTMLPLASTKSTVITVGSPATGSKQVSRCPKRRVRLVLTVPPFQHVAIRPSDGRDALA